MASLIPTALAVSRLTRLITEDEITAPVRDRVEQWASGSDYGSVRERLAYIPTCRACSSIYSAAVVAAALRWGREPGRLLVTVLSGSEAALVAAGLLDVISASTERLAGRAG